MMTIRIFAFWYFPLQAYSSYANQGMTDITDTSTFAAFSLQGVLGIGQLPDSYQFKDFFIFPPVWILGIAGVIIGFLYNRKIMFFSLLAILSLYCTGSFGIWKLLHPISPAIAMFFTLRPWYPLTTILCPVAGAMG